MNNNFEILNKTKKTIEYISKQLINYPKKERVIKEAIEKNMYEIIEIIFSYNINDTDRIRSKYLKDLIVKLSMLDFYIVRSYRKKIIKKKKFKSTARYIIEIRKMIYGLIRNEKNNVQ